MYIPYDFLYQNINIKPIKDYFYSKKIEQNCKYIQKNKVKVLKKIKDKAKIKVVFYVYDCCKWKCDAIYKKMCEIPNFEPMIVATRNSVKNINNPSYQTHLDIINTYAFFKDKFYNVEFGYDFTNDKHIPFEKFEPDIIIYQHPWYVETSQGPVVTSKFALSAYIPYDISTTKEEWEYNLRFHQYVQNYYIINDVFKEYYQVNMKNKGVNLKALGSPSLDLICEKENDKNYVIYAPHWTVNHKNTIAYSTFVQNGEFMLKYAKNNPQFNWVFKPHPLLKKAIIDNKIMSKDEVEKYYSEWEKVGIACYSGDYYDIFNESSLMITDCSTFLVEYLLTNKPLINIVSNEAVQYNEMLDEIVKVYYKANNNYELERYLDLILKENRDYLKKLRTNLALNFRTNASDNIINDLLDMIS